MGNMGELGIQVEDIAEIVLRFPNGALGSIHLDYIQRPASHHFEIIGTKGTLRWDNVSGILSIYRHNNSDWEHFIPPEGFERNWMFMDEIRHFVSIIRSEVPPLCTLDDGINALEIAIHSLSFNSQ
jgi:predicted dehydrogenase